MRKEHGKALREMFESRMAVELPAWKRIPLPKSHYFGGERGFVVDPADGLWLAIILIPNLKDHDAFDIQLGWSALNRVPQIGMRPCLEKPGSVDAVRRDEYLCSLSELTPGDQYRNGWVIDSRTFSTDAAQIMAAMLERQTKIADQQARDNLKPFVDDAMAVLLAHGVPYLKSVALARSGSSTPARA